MEDKIKEIGRAIALCFFTLIICGFTLLCIGLRVYGISEQRMIQKMDSISAKQDTLFNEVKMLNEYLYD